MENFIPPRMCSKKAKAFLYPYVIELADECGFSAKDVVIDTDFGTDDLYIWFYDRCGPDRIKLLLSRKEMDEGVPDGETFLDRMRKVLAYDEQSRARDEARRMWLDEYALQTVFYYPKNAMSEA